MVSIILHCTNGSIFRLSFHLYKWDTTWMTLTRLTFLPLSLSVFHFHLIQYRGIAMIFFDCPYCPFSFVICPLHLQFHYATRSYKSFALFFPLYFGPSNIWQQIFAAYITTAKTFTVDMIIPSANNKQAIITIPQMACFLSVLVRFLCQAPRRLQNVLERSLLLITWNTQQEPK